MGRPEDIAVPTTPARPRPAQSTASWSAAALDKVNGLGETWAALAVGGGGEQDADHLLAKGRAVRGRVTREQPPVPPFEWRAPDRGRPPAGGRRRPAAMRGVCCILAAPPP